MANNYYPVRGNNGPSWAVIVITLILIWPIGVYLLIKKLSTDRVARLNDGKPLMIAGAVLIGMGLLNVFRMAGYSYYMRLNMGGMLFYFGGGAVLLYMGMNMKKLSERYRRYISVVANQGVNDIEIIAGMVGVPAAQCRDDLQKMIDKGYFHDAYIDVGAGRIVLPQRQPVMPVQPAYAPAGGAPAQAAGPRAVQCRGCGANNMVLGPAGECEYCGGPL